MSPFRFLSLNETRRMLRSTDISKTSSFLLCSSFDVQVSALYGRMDCTKVWYNVVFASLLMFSPSIRCEDFQLFQQLIPLSCQCRCHLTHHLRLSLLDIRSDLSAAVGFHLGAHWVAGCRLLYTDATSVLILLILSPNLELASSILLTRYYRLYSHSAVSAMSSAERTFVMTAINYQ